MILSDKTIPLKTNEKSITTVMIYAKNENNFTFFGNDIKPLPIWLVAMSFYYKTAFN